MRNQLVRCLCIDILYSGLFDETSLMGKGSDLCCNLAKGLQSELAKILKHHKNQPYHFPILRKVNPVPIP